MKEAEQEYATSDRKQHRNEVWNVVRRPNRRIPVPTITKVLTKSLRPVVLPKRSEYGMFNRCSLTFLACDDDDDMTQRTNERTFPPLSLSYEKPRAFSFDLFVFIMYIMFVWTSRLCVNFNRHGRRVKRCVITKILPSFTQTNSMTTCVQHIMSE